MGRTNVYGERTIVYVTPVASSLVRYGFKTAIDESERGTLGHETFTPGTMVNGIVFGARFPRPAKYKKQTAAYSVSSFANAGTTVAAPYKKSGEPKVIPHLSKNSGRAILSFVDVLSGTTTLKYAWFIPEYQRTQILSALAGLGITNTITSTDQKNTIFSVGRKGGTRGFPVPARYSKTFDGDGESGNTVSTYGKATTLPTGWAELTAARTSL